MPENARGVVNLGLGFSISMCIGKCIPSLGVRPSRIKTCIECVSLVWACIQIVSLYRI